MRGKLMNIFLALGIVAIVVMLCTFDVSYAEIWRNLRKAGWWFFAVVGIWIPIYILNACSWAVIINNGSRGNHRLSFLRILKFTISGYALNYITPVGVLGGEPYRIMELTPYYGAAKATSSVILYAMMHIFSHFIFWTFSIVLYLLLYFHSISFMMAMLLAITTAFCATGIYFFMKGYNNGLAMKTLRFFTHIPGLRRRARRFAEEKRATVQRIDAQIAELHRANKRTFYLSLLLEFAARIVGCLEIWFIFKILTDSVSFFDCILIQAFTSLFANLFFFMPMEMGTREGGFALAVGGLSMSGAFGVLAGLLTRVRELIWVAIGILLIKVGKSPTATAPKSPSNPTLTSSIPISDEPRKPRN